MFFVSMLWCKLQAKCTGSWRYIIKNKALAKQLQHSNIVALLAATCCTCLATSVSGGAGAQNVWLPMPCSPDSLTYISQLLPLSILLTYLENNETQNTCSCAIVRHFIFHFSPLFSALHFFWQWEQQHFHELWFYHCRVVSNFTRSKPPVFSPRANFCLLVVQNSPIMLIANQLTFWVLGFWKYLNK